MPNYAPRDLETLIEEAIKNIHLDRDTALALLLQVKDYILEDPSKHQYYGNTAAKYLETMQRSNEQLVKLIALRAKEASNQTSQSFTEEDRKALYEAIKNGEEGEGE